jgi:hypothetical protein
MGVVNMGWQGAAQQCGRLNLTMRDIDDTWL